MDATHGTIVVESAGERALRTPGAQLRVAHVLGWTGAFVAGERVWLVVRGGDGGQRAFATALTCCDADTLARALAGGERDLAACVQAQPLFRPVQ